MPFGKIKEGLGKFLGKEDQQEYIEIDLGEEIRKNKVRVRPFVLKQYEDVNEILNNLREGYTIAVIDISPLRKRDMIELKRVIAKIKKTADALEGEIAGFGDSTIIVTPSFAEIHKPQKQLQQPKSNIEML